MSLLYLGGETAQIELQLPSAVTGVFQGMLLFYLLAADLFINFRLRSDSARRLPRQHPPRTWRRTARHEHRAPDPDPRQHGRRRDAADLCRARAS